MLGARDVTPAWLPGSFLVLDRYVRARNLTVADRLIGSGMLAVRVHAEAQLDLVCRHLRDAQDAVRMLLVGVLHEPGELHDVALFPLPPVPA